nr:PAS domain-containing protein [Planosporangium flavigriseum]
MGRWAKAVADAAESSLVIDAESIVVALSPACQEMFGLDRPPIDRPLLEVLHLLDFSNSMRALGQGELRKIPPLLALDSGQLARGLMRVECRDGPRTVDAIATPVCDSAGQVGSLTFFCPV